MKRGQNNAASNSSRAIVHKALYDAVLDRIDVMYASGKTHKQVAEALGIHRTTAHHYFVLQSKVLSIGALLDMADKLGIGVTLSID